MLTATAARILDEMLLENEDPQMFSADEIKAIRMAIRSLKMDTTENEKGSEK